MLDTLLPWGVIGFVVTCGWGFLSVDDYKKAKVCFLIAALFAEGQIVMLAAESSRGGIVPWLICFAACGLVGVFAMAALRYVDKKRDSKLGTSQVIPAAKRDAPLPTASQEPPNSLPRHYTLHDYFLNDFPLISFAGEPYTWTPNKKGESVQVESRLLLDFDAQATFISFYIPSTPLTYDVCRDIANKARKMALQLQTTGDVQGGKLGERQTHVKELKFSGRVYIYHDNPMFDYEEERLLPLFRKKGLSVRFHDPHYADAQNDPLSNVKTPQERSQPSVTPPATDADNQLRESIIDTLKDLQSKNDKVTCEMLLSAMEGKKFNRVHRVTVIPELMRMRRDGLLDWGNQDTPGLGDVLELNPQMQKK